MQIDVAKADNGWGNYQGKEQDFVSITYFNDCEGKDSMNYTIVATGRLSSDCMTVVRADDYLISNEKKGENEVNGIQMLARSTYPLGGNQAHFSLTF